VQLTVLYVLGIPIGIMYSSSHPANQNCSHTFIVADSKSKLPPEPVDDVIIDDFLVDDVLAGGNETESDLEERWYNKEVTYHENHSGYGTTTSTRSSFMTGGLDGRLDNHNNPLRPSVVVERLSQTTKQQRQGDGDGNGGGDDQPQTEYNLTPQGLSRQPVRFQFPFPSIQHTVYVKPIQLKAHSSFDLSETDPEIFAIVQSLLTPYLQTLLGQSLHAYTLEIDYSPGHDDNDNDNVPTAVASEGGAVVTNLQVSCTLRVVSDTIDSLTMVTHKQVRRWVHDFFVGDELSQLLTEFRNNNINVNELVFADDEFTFGTNNGGGQVISGISGGADSSSSSSTGGKSGNPGAMVGVTLAVIAVGVVLFLHFTGRLPSKERLSSLRDSLGSRGGSRSSEERSHRSKSTNPFLDDDDDLNKSELKGLHQEDRAKGRGRRLWLALFGRSDGHNTSDTNDDEERGERRRTYSGTFRRFPTGGLRPAAIQKHPAQSKHYLKDVDTSKSSIALSSASASSSSSSNADVGANVIGGGRRPRTRKSKTLSSAESNIVFDDVSFSYHDSAMGIDYDLDGVDEYGGPRTPTSHGHSRSNHSNNNNNNNDGHRRSFRQNSPNEQHNGDEFSMPEDYDTVTEDQPSVYSKWSQSVSFLPRSGFWSASSPRRSNNVPSLSPQGVSTSPLVSTPTNFSPRRVTPSDIASPNEYRRGTSHHNAVLDEWSVGSYDTKSPSARHCQQQQQQRQQPQPYRDRVSDTNNTNNSNNNTMTSKNAPSPTAEAAAGSRNKVVPSTTTPHKPHAKDVDYNRFKLSIPRFT
jgi:hypothetical protein